MKSIVFQAPEYLLTITLDRPALLSPRTVFSVAMSSSLASVCRSMSPFSASQRFCASWSDRRSTCEHAQLRAVRARLRP